MSEQQAEIPLARPNVSEEEIESVVAVLRTPCLSLGPRLAEFEAAFARYCGVREAIACSSGTAALHMLVRAIGAGPGDEVITTPFSFVASANCTLYEGARPVFADVRPDTWNIDPDAVAAAVTARTRAIIPVDVFGQVADLDPILALAQCRGVRVIEDSCEALGGRYRGRPAGSIADAGVFGFYPNKQITTGEGGMVTTSDPDLARLLRSLRNQGRDDKGGWLAHPRMGYNYRLSEIACALGLVQLRRIGEILAQRRRVAELYRQRLAGQTRLVTQVIRPDVDMSWFVYVVRLADDYPAGRRDEILTALRERGIGCSNYFAPIHLQPYFVERFGYARGDFPVCEALADRTIALPFHHELTAQDVDRVCGELEKLL
ncbi:MAG: DegT/DnrJ/EryC1/StrS family aminotransferase [Phycisphaerales bacterium]|nr:MAG: DegT/DnrJ/EryC1/StrS family aminotransferase [Phycisphaerales bacterium]